MIRVGFIIAYNEDWLGGLNYFRNLLNAISRLSDRKIEPVILTGAHTSAQQLAGFPPVEIVRSQLLDLYTLPWALRKSCNLLFGQDWILEQLLFKNHIAVLSHSVMLGRKASIPAIGWIPDFQHRRMPEFFNQKQLRQREKGFTDILQQSKVIIVSSLNAQSDLSFFYPDYACHSRVLQFVAEMDNKITYPSLDILKKKYAIKTDSYFHLPNQFYIHKNHYVVINALKALKMQGQPATVLATGNTSDLRWPHYYESLLKSVKECGVEEEFKVIGIVPYADLIALMKHSIGIINPSFFEGWSTTVEEAKAIGKRIILSDIPVHREQAPIRGVYFNPNNPQELANAMKQQMDAWNPNEDADWLSQAIAEMPARRENFAKKYQEIVLGLFS